MTIQELDKELIDAIELIDINWRKCEDPECLPEIMRITLDNFRESIIEYLSTNNDK